MSKEESFIEILLKDLETTAEKLRAGAVVTQEELLKYHGQSGLILARSVRSLLTREQMVSMMRTEIKANCSACEGARRSLLAAIHTDAMNGAPRDEMPGTLKAAVAANFRLVAFLFFGVVLILGIFTIATGQLKEAGVFTKNAGQAIRSAHAGPAAGYGETDTAAN